jgi:hypothetical protein
MEHKGKRRRDCAQVMASGVGTVCVYTKLSPCAGNRAVSLEMQMLFSTGRFGFAECYWCHNFSDIKVVAGGYILLLHSAGVPILYLRFGPFVGWAEFAVSWVLRSKLYMLVIFQGPQNSDNMLIA